MHTEWYIHENAMGHGWLSIIPSGCFGLVGPQQCSTSSRFAEHISTRLWIEDLFSKCTYIRMWWLTLRNVTQNVITYMHPTQGRTDWHIQVCSTQIDVVDHRRQRSLVMEMEVRGNSEAEPWGLTASTANVTCATRTPHPHMTRMHRLCTGARQRCTRVFLVN